MSLAHIRSLLRSEILQVAGCTEPASVAYAFLVAQRRLAQPCDPGTARATLTASSEVLRNASTAMAPYLNRRGLRAVVAAGLSADTDDYNLFPSVDRRAVKTWLRRKGWLTVHPRAAQRGVYIEATLATPAESVTVVLRGHHDEIRRVSRSGRTLFKAAPLRLRAPALAGILAAAKRRDGALEALARDFLVRQARGSMSQPWPERVAALVRARMMGAPTPIMTIVGSGNHGLFLGVPFYDLYRRQGERILPAVVVALLAVIHMTGRRRRISDECGLGTKAAPSLAAGLAYARGASAAEIRRLMRSVSLKLRDLKCYGARASCGGKARRALRVVLEQLASS